MPKYLPGEPWNVHPQGAKSASKPVALDKHRGTKKTVRVK